MIFGYLDPGTGSLILQALIGGLAGIGVAIKALRSRYRRHKIDEPDRAEETVEDDALPTGP